MGSNETILETCITLADLRNKKRKLIDLKNEAASEIEGLNKKEAALITKEFAKVAKEIRIFRAYSVDIAGTSHLFATHESATKFAKEKLQKEPLSIDTEEVNEHDLAGWADDNTLHYE